MLFPSNEEKPQETIILSWDDGSGRLERKWPASEIPGLGKAKEGTSTFLLFRFTACIKVLGLRKEDGQFDLLILSQSHWCPTNAGQSRIALKSVRFSMCKNDILFPISSTVLFTPCHPCLDQCLLQRRQSILFFFFNEWMDNWTSWTNEKVAHHESTAKHRAKLNISNCCFSLLKLSSWGRSRVCVSGQSPYTP